MSDADEDLSAAETPDEEILQALAYGLRLLRVRMDYPRTEIALRAGLPVEHLAAAEAGKRDLPFTELIRILEAIQVDASLRSLDDAITDWSGWGGPPRDAEVEQALADDADFGAEAEEERGRTA